MIAFRLLAAADLPLLHRWLNLPHVLEWWDNPGPSLEQVEHEYQPQLGPESLTKCYIMLRDGSPVGYIQTYLIGDHPDYSCAVDVEAGAAGLDIFIGESAQVHRGLGAQLLRGFLRTVVFARPDVTCCVIGPAVSNTGAIRAYEKTGFRYLKTVQVPEEAEPEYLMRISRAEADALPGE